MTPRQEEIREYLKSFIMIKGMSPTREEIAEHLGLSCQKSIKRHLMLMREEGVIDWEARKPRSIKLIDNWVPLSEPVGKVVSEIKATYTYVPVSARDYGYRPNAPKWNDVLAHRRFDEPRLMHYPKQGTPIYAPHGCFET